MVINTESGVYSCRNPFAIETKNTVENASIPNNPTLDKIKSHELPGSIPPFAFILSLAFITAEFNLQMQQNSD